jgi:hypothetical protein
VRGALLDGGVVALVLELVTQAHEAHAHGEGGRGVGVRGDVVGADARREEGVVLDVGADGVGGRAAGLLGAAVAGAGRGGQLLQEALPHAVLGRRVAVAPDVVRAHARREERVVLDEHGHAMVRRAHVRVLECWVRVVGPGARHVGVDDGLEVLRHGVLGVGVAIAPDVVRAHARRDNRVVGEIHGSFSPSSLLLLPLFFMWGTAAAVEYPSCKWCSSSWREEPSKFQENLLQGDEMRSPHATARQRWIQHFPLSCPLQSINGALVESSHGVFITPAFVVRRSLPSYCSHTMAVRNDTHPFT